MSHELKTHHESLFLGGKQAPEKIRAKLIAGLKLLHLHLCAVLGQKWRTFALLKCKRKGWYKAYILYIPFVAQQEVIPILYDFGGLYG